MVQQIFTYIKRLFSLYTMYIECLNYVNEIWTRIPMKNYYIYIEKITK